MFGRAEDILLATGKLNSENNADKGAFAGLAGLPGQLGKIVALTTAEALKLSLTTTGTLYGGLYQCVQFKAASSASNARGQIVCWDTPGSYIVTPDLAAIAQDGKVAGITLNAVTKGYYGWIQIAGLASVKFRASVTDKTDGNLVLVLTATPTADAIADATGTYVSGGVKGIKNVLGVAQEAPTDGGVNLVWLKNIAINL